MTIVANDNNELIPQRTVAGNLIMLLEKIIILCLLLIKCLKDCLRILTFIFLMVIPVSLKLLLNLKIKKRLLLLVPMELMLIDVCLLVCVMHQLLFRDDFSVYGTSFDNCLYNLNKVS